jgi:methylphosphotriester-DNA--protein-cysteine methyltransferase
LKSFPNPEKTGCFLFSPVASRWVNPACVLEDLKLGERYDGFLFLAESRLKPPILQSHRHPELELNLVTDGSVTYLIRGRRYTFPRGSMVWIFPAQEHQLVDRTPDARYYVAVFKPELIQRACQDPAYAELKRQSPRGGGVPCRLLKPETFELLTRTMDALTADGLDPDLLNREAGFGFQSDFRYAHGDPDALNAGLRHLLIQCWKCFRAGEGGVNPVQLHPAILKVLGLLENADAEAGLPELAARCGVSPTYLSRLFKRQVGVALSHYRNALRLRRFMEHHHRPGRRTLLESVYAAGFGSYAQFYKVFAAFHGQGPRTFLAADGDRLDADNPAVN